MHHAWVVGRGVGQGRESVWGLAGLSKEVALNAGRWRACLVAVIGTAGLVVSIGRQTPTLRSRKPLLHLRLPLPASSRWFDMKRPLAPSLSLCISATPCRMHRRRRLGARSRRLADMATLLDRLLLLPNHSVMECLIIPLHL
jgi:hypothetical protein